MEVSWRIKPYVDMLTTGQVFTQANYGDGEWSCILGRTGINNQGDIYTPELQGALSETLTAPRFSFFGTNPGAAFWNEAWEWCARNWVIVPWVHKEMLPSANVRGHLGPFIRALQHRSICLVGPPHLWPAICDIFPGAEFVEVPLPGASATVAQTVEDVWEVCLNGRADVVLFSSGMATNVTMHALMPRVGMSGITMMDCGAIWDPYVGVHSRWRYALPEAQRLIADVHKEMIQ